MAIIIIDGFNGIRHPAMPGYHPADPYHDLTGWESLESLLPQLAEQVGLIIVVVYDEKPRQDRRMRNGGFTHKVPGVITKYYTTENDQGILWEIEEYVKKGESVIVITSDTDLQDRCRQLYGIEPIPSGTAIRFLRDRQMVDYLRYYQLL